MRKIKKISAVLLSFAIITGMSGNSGVSAASKKIYLETKVVEKNYEEDGSVSKATTVNTYTNKGLLKKSIRTDLSGKTVDTYKYWKNGNVKKYVSHSYGDTYKMDTIRTYDKKGNYITYYYEYISTEFDYAKKSESDIEYVYDGKKIIKSVEKSEDYYKSEDDLEYRLTGKNTIIETNEYAGNNIKKYSCINKSYSDYDGDGKFALSRQTEYAQKDTYKNGYLRKSVYTSTDVSFDYDGNEDESSKSVYKKISKYNAKGRFLSSKGYQDGKISDVYKNTYYKGDVKTESYKSYYDGRFSYSYKDYYYVKGKYKGLVKKNISENEYEENNKTTLIYKYKLDKNKNIKKMTQKRNGKLSMVVTYKYKAFDCN